MAIGSDVRVIGRPILQIVSPESVTLGDRVRLLSDSRLSTLGIDHPLVLQTRNSSARIVIGRDVGITGGTICAAQEVTIGDGTMLGANVTVVDTDFHPLSSRARRYEPALEPSPGDRVAIGRNVFIGTRSIVLKGVSIGDDAVIGAGSIVVSDIPSGAVAAGNPARVIRMLEFDAATED